MKFFSTAPGLCLFSLLFLAVSCTSNEIASNKDVNPETVYFDYRVSGDEEGQDITIMLQYRFGGMNGTTLVLEPPSQVQFDGETIPVDSSRMSGAYYEIRKPAAGFAGKHTIVFTDLNNKQYREEFEFPVFFLDSSGSRELSRSADLNLQLSGLPEEDSIQLLLNDTSFYSRGIDRAGIIRDGKLQISSQELAQLKPGPVYLEIYRDFDKPLKYSTQQGGRLSLSYGLKREFELKD